MQAVIAYQDANGNKYLETSEEWKEACSVLPCFKQIAWPDYSTVVIEDHINGKPVVIQLWKGWCQQFLGMESFPGGIGGEVGIYERVAGRGFPVEKPDFLPHPVWNFLKAASKLSDGDFWWPVAEKNEIEFDFINPINNTVMFHAGPEKTYWMNKWMDPDSYEKYRREQGKKWSWLPDWFPQNSPIPVFADQYLLDYKINGKSYPRW